MLIHINSGFCHNRPKKMLANFFRISNFAHGKITISALTSVNFHGSFWNVARTFIAQRSWSFNYGGSALLHMCIIGHLMSQAILAFLGSFLAATKQLYEWYFLSVCPSVRLSVCPSVRPSVRLSVCPSVRLSVCHTFLTMFPSSYHHEIFRSYHIGQG